jgi:hypothetical protein
MSLPADNLITTNTKPAFTWAAVTNAARYDIEIDKSDTFDGIGKIASTITSLTYTPSSALAGDGTWYWRVRARNTNNEPGPWAVARTFTLDTTGPDAPVLNIPADGKQDLRAVPTFTWAASDGANAYQFQYDDDFSDPILFSTPGDTVSGTPITTTSYKPSTMPLITVIQWRVRGRDSLGNWGAWSSVRTVEILPSLITAVPVMSLPADNLITTNTKPVFTWEAVTNAARYDIEIDKSDTFDGTEKIASTITSLTYTPSSALAGDGTWYWRVRARNTNNEPGPWAVARTFTIDTTGPDAPVLSTPADGKIDLRAVPTFTWAASAGANAYQFQYGETLDPNNDAALFSTPGKDVTGTPITTTSYKPSTMPLITVIQWRVRGRDSLGNWGSWSTVRTVEILPSLITSVPVLSLPAANSVISTDKLVFTWSPVTNATGYNVEIDKVSTFDSAALIPGDVSGTTFTPDSTLFGDNETWYWHVQAKNDNDDLGSWSATRSFTMDTVGPNAPILNDPVGDPLALRAVPTFTWMASAGANAYQFQYGETLDPNDDSAVFSTPGKDVTGTPIITTSYKPASMPLMKEFQWRVRARDVVGNWGAWSDVKTVKILPLKVTAAPVLSLPAANSIISTDKLVFTWAAVTNATSYDIEIDKVNTFDGIGKIASTITALTYTPSLELAGDGAWYWRVRARNAYNEIGPWSVTQSFTLDTTGPDAPVLNIPADGKQDLRAIPTFTWAASKDATAYQFQYDDDNFASGTPILFSTPGDTVTGTPITTTSYKPASMPLITVIQWRVRGRDSLGNWGPWSSVRTVEILPSLITSVPVLSLPAANSVISTDKLVFTWSPVTNATGYNVEIDKVSTFDSAALIPGDVSGTTFTPDSTLFGDNETWYWHVQAKNDNDDLGSWSATRSFTMDTVGPNAPILNDPVGDPLALRAVPTFTWMASAGANAYQFQYGETLDPNTDAALFSTPGKDVTGTPITTMSYKPASMPLMKEFQWRVRARDVVGNWSLWSDVKTVEILPLKVTAAPVLSLPAANSIISTDKLVFTWSSVTNATGYNVEIDKVSTFDSAALIPGDVSGTTFTPDSTLFGDKETWYWHVQAKNAYNEFGPWSAIRSYTMDTVGPDAPILNDPAGNPMALRAVPTFTWMASAGANAYQFQYGETLDPNDDSAVFSTPGKGLAGTPITTMSYKPASMPLMKEFQWRVRARDVVGNWGPWSSVRTVEILPSLITAVPVLSLPAANSKISPDKLVFTWSPVTNATGYNVEIYKVSTSGSITLISGDVTGTTFTPNSELFGDNETWYWHVQAKNDNDDLGSWSATRSFTMDTVGPDAPILNDLVGDPLALRAVPTFTWMASAGANAYQFQYGETLDPNDDSAVFSTPGKGLTGTPIITTSYKPASMPLMKEFQWRVRARDVVGNWGAWSDVKTVEILPLKVTAAPVLSLPAANSIISTDKLVFTWSSVTNATGYNVEIDKVSTFDSAALIPGDVSGTTFTPDSTLFGDNETWYWHVQAKNDNDDLGPWSATRRFTMDTVGPDAPELNDPAGDPLKLRAVPAFTWMASAGANAYQFQYGETLDPNDDSAVFSTPGKGLAGTPITTMSYKPASMPLMKEFQWRVRARDVVGNWGPWSDVKIVKILPLEVKAAPVLSLPTSGFLTNNPQPTFTWAKVVNAATYEIEIDNTGNFDSYREFGETSSLTFTPQNALAGSGTWYWHVRGKNANTDDLPGPWSATRTFILDMDIPAAPILVSPENYDPLTTNLRTIPTFTWKAVDGANAYQWQYFEASDNEFLNPIFTTPGDKVTGTPITSTSYRPTSMAIWKDFMWRVRARDVVGNWGDWSDVHTVKILPLKVTAAPVLSTPAVGYLTSNANPSFSWTAAANAVKYDIEIDNVSSFTGFNKVIGTVSSLAYKVETSLPGDGVWYWHVRGVNASDEPGPWAAARTFTLDATAPDAPELVSPVNNQEKVRAIPTFSWKAIIGVNGYQWQYTTEDDTDFSSPIFTTPGPDSKTIGSILTTTTYRPATMSTMVNYLWRVRARDTAGNWGAWSNETDPRYIRIVPLLTTAPVVSLPAANSVITTQTPDFKWAAAVNAVSYDIEIDRVNSFTNEDRQKFTVNGLSYTATPLTLQGAWFWRVRARNDIDETGPWSAVRSFTIDTYGPDKPELSLPVDAALTLNTKPVFSWKAAVTAAKYQIQIADNEEFDSAFTSAELTTTNFTPTTALSEGTIYWRVRAKDLPGNWGDWSGAKTVIIDTTPPNAPSLFSPESGWVTMKTTPFFMWFKPASAETYQFRYDNDANMSSPLHTSSVITVASYTAPKMAAGVYYWQARAADKAGNWSAWSEIRSIQIDITPPPVPVLTGPANGYSSIYQVFTWNASSGAIGYQIQYDANATFSSPIDYTADEPSTTHIPEKLIPSGKYYWRVRAVDEAGNWSAWSASRNFTVPE